MSAVLDELIAGRWPGAEVPRLALEQIVTLAMIRHPDDREIISQLVPAAAVHDHHCQVVYRATLEVDRAASDPYEAVAAQLTPNNVHCTPLDLLVEGGDVVFLGGGHWRQAVAELGRRHEADRLRHQLVAALCSLDAGARPARVVARIKAAAAPDEGLAGREAEGTIQSGFHAGARQPRQRGAA